MKNITRFIAVSLLLCAHTMVAKAQAPQYVNYQAVARNGTGAPILNSSVAVRISIRDGAAAGPVLYSERDTATTNAFGLFTCKIGAGNVISGTFNSINWASGDKYMQVELDATGGSSYTDMGTTQLLSVPYALHAATAGNQNWTSNGTNLYPTDTTSKVGIGTASPTHEVSIRDVFGGYTNIGDNGGWTHIGFANSSVGPYNAIANGGSYLSFLYAVNRNSQLTSKMVMDGISNNFRPTSDNIMSLGTASNRWTTVYATNGTIQTSDERYKQNVANLNYGLSEVMQLRPVSYQWKDKNLQLGTGTNLGFIAQELERVVPDLVIHEQVKPDAETGKVNNQYNDAYGVKYAEFIPVLTKAIQEQQAVIEQLKKEIELLKAR